MGQQQLLLLVLGIVLVGLAVVAGIQAFQESGRRSALDDATSRTAQYAGLVTAWRLTPVALGGGAGLNDTRTLSFADLGVQPQVMIHEHLDAIVAQLDADKALAVWYLTDPAGPIVQVWDRKHGLMTVIYVRGTGNECLASRYAYLTGTRTQTWADFLSGVGRVDDLAGIPTFPASCRW